MCMPKRNISNARASSGQMSVAGDPEPTAKPPPNPAPAPGDELGFRAGFRAAVKLRLRLSCCAELAGALYRPRVR